MFGVLEAGREGAYAEKLAINAAIIAKKPDGLSHIDAAALALTGLTAVISIETTLKLQRGETILIQGSAGGVASFAIQLAKHLGAHVITTTSAANADYVRGLGADEVIDYNAQDFTGAVKARRRVRYRRRRGRAEIVRRAEARRPRRLHRLRAAVDEARCAATSPRCSPPSAGGRAPLERIAQLVAAGAVRPPEVKLYRLAQAAEAHRLSKSRHFRGKLVFQVR